MQRLIEDLQDQWVALPDYAQEAIALLGIVLVIWVVKRVVLRRLITRLRHYTQASARTWDQLVVDAIDRPLSYFAMSLVLGAVLVLFDFGATLHNLITQTANTLVIIAIFLLVYALFRFLSENRERFYRFTSIDIQQRLLPFVQTGVRVVLIALALVMILGEWGYDVNGLIAGLGIGGLAIALAAQDTLANLFGFTTIVGDHPLSEGEYIVTPDVEGVVEHVGLRSTRVRRLDQALVTIPNSMLSTTAVLNWSRLSKRRFDTVIGITYGADSDQMRALLARIRGYLQAHEQVETDSVVVYFINFGDSALEVLVRCYLQIADWGQFTAEREVINLQIMDIVRDVGLSMAFPSRSLYIENLPEIRTSVPPTSYATGSTPPAKPIAQADEPGDGFHDEGTPDDGGVISS